ncbi:unnamed protein product [Clonostachys chloroleuca]|uniref:Uncharacterized protein n=1 Tax=Clonostachys chloroleuca TaxID=1926264 RepID=A0AA35MAJ2_9HYPO|nr:unnamed protein product [Clonostachys chloroleuca]
MSFLTKRLTKDQSLALGRVAEQVRQSLDRGSLVPELPQLVHGLLRELTEAHGPDETVDELYKKDFIAIKHKVMRLLNQSSGREKFCEEVGRHLDQLPDPKARARDATARREEVISAGVHNQLDRGVTTPKVESADELIRKILPEPRLVVHQTHRPPSPGPPLHQSSPCAPLESAAPLLDDSNTNTGRDKMNASARSVAQTHQVPATSNVIVISEEEDTPDSVASASSQSASNRHPISAPDAATLSKLDDIFTMSKQPISGRSSTASAVQFLAGTDTTAAQAVNQQSGICSAPNTSFSLGQRGVLALQQRRRSESVARYMRQQTVQSPFRTKQYGQHSRSRVSISRSADEHCAKKQKIGPEQLSQDAHLVSANNNTLTGGGDTSNSVRDTQFPSSSEQADVVAEAWDISMSNFSPNANSRPNRDLGLQNPEARTSMEPRNINPITCDEPSNHGQMLEPEPPVPNLQAAAQPKSEKLDTAAGLKIDGGDKEMSYTRNLLRKLMEVIKEVDANKKASEAQSDTQGEDPAEAEAIYSMYVQINDILHKQQRR